MGEEVKPRRKRALRPDCKHSSPACAECIVRREVQRAYRERAGQLPRLGPDKPRQFEWGTYFPDAPF